MKFLLILYCGGASRADFDLFEENWGEKGELKLLKTVEAVSVAMVMLQMRNANLHVHCQKIFLCSNVPISYTIYRQVYYFRGSKETISFGRSIKMKKLLKSRSFINKQRGRNWTQLDLAFSSRSSVSPTEGVIGRSHSKGPHCGSRSFI